MRKFYYRQIIISLFFLLLVLVATLSLAFPWLFKQTTETFTFNTGDYNAFITVTLSDVPVDETGPYYDSEKQVIVLDGYNPESPNYINNIEVTMTMTADSASRFRVKIQDEWQLTRTYYGVQYVITEALSFQDAETIPGNPLFPFTVLDSANYTYDVNTGYLYYNAILEKGETYVINFIAGGLPHEVRSTDAYYEECSVFLDFKLDLVQANRFSDIWGVPVNFFG